MKPIGWAALGLARVMFAQGRIEDTQAALKDLIAANPRLMAAYDLLARCHEAEGDQQQAKQVLEAAVSISPHMVRRLRRLGEVALDVGDVNAAEKSFKQVVSKARYSEFRNPEDHVNLVKALVRKGDATQASGVVRDLERSLRGSPGLDVCMAYSQALLHEAAGNKSAVASDLQHAAAAVRASTGLSAALKMGLARACLANQLDAEASDVMLTVVNDVQSEVTAEQAQDVFAKAGRPDLASGMGERLKAQVQQLLAVADEKRNMGDVRGAVQSLLEAMHIAPRSAPVKLAVVGGVLRQLNELGWDHTLGELANEQLHLIRDMEPDYPRLQALTDELNATRRKYGISTTA
jgi:tetratricopeptide (TPR) repeat protein